MIAISSLDFLLLSCLHVPLRNALLKITKYMSSTGIIRNFGRLRAILWNVFNRLSRFHFTSESSFKGTLDWALANVFEDLDFFPHNYCERNKTARSRIYQRHRHLNQLLDQKLHLHPQATEHFHGGHVGGLKQWQVLHENRSCFIGERKCIVFALQNGGKDVTWKCSILILCLLLAWKSAEWRIICLNVLLFTTAFYVFKLYCSF